MAAVRVADRELRPFFTPKALAEYLSISQQRQHVHRARDAWHGLGVVLDEYRQSIDEAFEKAALGWKVTHGDVLVVSAPEWTAERRLLASE